MKKSFSYILVLSQFILFAQQRPKLVVGIVVDQMKMDYLYRFDKDFSENGFKRLINNGYTFYNMHYNYLPTYTAPGHASIFTGTTPAIHGIVGNEWYSRSLAKEVYCTEDASVKLLGDADKDDEPMSPKNLQATTITDELRLSTNFKGKVIGISIKDRGAILPAGHFANGAFWLSKTGNFISSDFYVKALPNWVNEFNSNKNYMKYINQGWNLYKPIDTYNESLEDKNDYEEDLYKQESVFPFDLKAMYDRKGAEIIKSTPFGSDFLAEFAKKAIEAEALGKDEITDFLTLSFSSPDYIGHKLGPRSMEIQDTYLRLDETIADFLNYLDKSVGKGNYLVFLTADHAGAENTKFLKDNKYNVTNVEPKDIKKDLKSFSEATFGENLLLDYSSFNVFFDKAKIKAKSFDLTVVKNAFKNYLLTQSQVKRVYSEEEILSSSGSDYYLQCIANGYDVTQNGDLVVLDKPGYIEYGEKGTSHGTIYAYDTHVPLLFYGWKIKKGQCFDKKVITQIAPTLAQKLNITMPNATTGDVLSEILNTK